MELKNALVESELEWHEQLKLAVREEALRQRAAMSQSYAKGVLDLRDQASSAKTDDLPALFDYLHSSQQLAGRGSGHRKLPDLRAPYFARVRWLDDKQQTRDIMLGHETLIDNTKNICLIDWQTAPLAQIFYLFKEGDDFEFELPQKTMRGKILERRILSFEKGELVSIRTANDEYQRDCGWEPAPLHREFSGGQGSAVRMLGGKRDVSIDIAALLDSKQYALLNASIDQPLLILGSAGSGKTTVAVHRLATLHKKHHIEQHELLFLVPEQGLARLATQLLASLGMERVLVSTYDEWLHDQVSYVFPQLKKRLCTQTPSSLVAFKRDAAAERLLDRLVERKAKKLRMWIAKHSAESLRESTLAAFDSARVLSEKVQAAIISVTRAHPRYAEEFRTNLLKECTNVYGDLIEAYQQPELMAEVAAGTRFAKTLSKEIYRHTLAQISVQDGPSERDLDPEYAATLDDQELADEEIDEVYQTIDAEDLTLMHQLLTKTMGRLPDGFHRYRHIVVDEAQEIAKSELRVIARSLLADGNVTLAGDAMQHNDPYSGFTGWADSIAALNIGEATMSELMTSYRCGAEVMDLALAVLGPLAPPRRPESAKQGPPPIITRSHSDGHACSLIIEELERLVIDEPRASIAVICSDDTVAKDFYRGIRKVIPAVRYVRRGDFSFEPGIDVTTAAETKGLEFDYVILPDVDHLRYPETDSHRRLLHVAMTRAVYQLWILTGKIPSLLLPR